MAVTQRNDVVSTAPARARFRHAVAAIGVLVCVVAIASEPRAAPLDTDSAADVEHAALPEPVQLITVTTADSRLDFELMLPSTGQPPYSVVLMLPDVLAARRSLPYADALLGGGVAVLEIASDDESPRRPTLPALASAALSLIGADARLDPKRIGLLGFGGGARIALNLTSGRFVARALLYPGCSTLEQASNNASGDPLLLVHGGQDAANLDDACTEAVRRLAQNGREVRRIRYADAGYAWDHPAYGLERRILLPRPDRPGLVSAMPWPELASMSAAQVAGFLGAAMAAASR